MTALGAIRCVWLRHFDVYRKSLTYGIVTTFAEPLLYLFSFGFGLGSMIGTVKLSGVELTYRQFNFAGIAGQTMLFKAFFSASVVMIIGIVMGDFSRSGAILALPLSFAGATLFAALGLLVAAKSRTIEEISYPQYLLVFPMFLFCGVFFPLSMLPVYLQWLSWALPLTSIVSLMRTLTLGTPLQPQVFIVIIVWLAILVPWSRQAMSRRLIK